MLCCAYIARNCNNARLVTGLQTSVSRLEQTYTDHAKTIHKEWWYAIDRSAWTTSPFEESLKGLELQTKLSELEARVQQRGANPSPCEVVRGEALNCPGVWVLRKHKCIGPMTEKW